MVIGNEWHHWHGWKGGGRHDLNSDAINHEYNRYIIVLRHLLSIIPLVSLACTQAMAQCEVPFSQYWDTETYFNPAAAGRHDMLNVAAAYTVDFSGTTQNPRAAYAGADMPLSMLPGGNAVGVSFLNSETGRYRHQRWAAQYAYRLKIGAGKLSLGLQAGLLTEKLTAEETYTDTGNTETSTSTTDSQGNAFDLSAGIYYYKEVWYAGLSVQHLNSPTIVLADDIDFKIDPAYYFTAGYNIKLRNPFIKIQPSVLLRYSDTDLRADITARISYDNKDKQVYGGLSYSPDNSLTALIGGAYKGFRIGYAYERHTAGTASGSDSHGFFAGYQAKLNIGKKVKHKHKSVRLL